MKSTSKILLIVWLSFVCFSLAFAQSEIIYDALPENVNPQEVEELEERDEGRVHERLRSSSSDDEIVQRVMQITEDVRNRFKALLEEDDTGTYEEYLKDVEEGQSRVMNPEDRDAFVNRLREQYADFFERKFKETNPDTDQIRREIMESVPDYCKVNKYLCLTCIRFPKSEPPAPPKEEHFSYSAPFSYTSTHKYTAAANILQLHRAHADKSGNTSVDVAGGVGLMGATSALARVGHHVRVPKGLRKVEVDVLVSYRDFVQAIAIFGAGSASCEKDFVVTGPNNFYHQKPISSILAVAPVLFYFQASSNKNNVKVSTNFKPHSNGGTYKIVVRNWARVITIINAGGVAGSTTKLKNISGTFYR